MSIRAGMERAAEIAGKHVADHSKVRWDRLTDETRNTIIDEGRGETIAAGLIANKIRAAMPPIVRPSPEAEAEAIEKIRGIVTGEQATIDAVQTVLSDLYAE